MAIYPIKTHGGRSNWLQKNWLLILLILVTLLIWLSGINQELFLCLNKWHVIFPDDVWLFFTVLAMPKLGILPIILLLITGIYRRGCFRNIVLVLIVYYIVFELLKVAIKEPRPFVILDHHLFYWLNKYETTPDNFLKSFPSGHCGLATIFALSIFTLFKKKNSCNILFRVVTLLFVVLVALSRICTGFHWPLDLLGSIIISYLIFNICFYLRIGRSN